MIIYLKFLRIPKELFSKSAFGQGFGSEAPDSVYSFEKSDSFFLFLRRVILIRQLLSFSFFTLLSWCQESNQRRHKGDGGFDSSSPLPPNHQTTKGDYPLCTPIVCRRMVVCLKFWGSQEELF